jgi:hypothetical protein
MGAAEAEGWDSFTPQQALAPDLQENSPGPPSDLNAILRHQQRMLCRERLHVGQFSAVNVHNPEKKDMGSSPGKARPFPVNHHVCPVIGPVVG